MSSALGPGIPELTAAQTVDYLRDVQPILADRCEACHGADEHSRQPRRRPLRLDRRDEALATAIVPGDFEASPLGQRIVANDSTRMPPASTKQTLTPQEIEILRRWIEQGAAYAEHWAYVPFPPPAERPEPPAAVDEGWIRNPIDRYVLSPLEEKSLRPSPTASPRQRVRRLAFDLLGLPPSQAQVESFAADPSPERWSATVEEMLASVHHGERLATFWFDLVRFADTTGIHADNPWNVHPYRDWVIDAFHRNMPFDQFTREQLAGDLLPNATQSQRVAAAYNRLNLITREGGSQPKEFLVRYTADRVRNASEVWLATTLGCAECHDHKFDPIRTREFYEFGAFFADIQQVGVYSEGSENNFKPEMKVPSERQSGRLDALKKMLADLQQRIDMQREAVAPERPAWEQERVADEAAWKALSPLEMSSESGASLGLLDDQSVLASGASPDKDVYVLLFKRPPPGATGLRLELLADESHPEQGPGRAANGNLVLTALELHLGEQVLKPSAQLTTAAQNKYPLEAALDGVHDAKGWALLIDGQATPADAIFEFDRGSFAPLAAGSAVAQDDRLRVTMRMHYGGRHTVGRFRWSWTKHPQARRSAIVPPSLRASLKLASSDRDPADDQRLADLHFAHVPRLLPLREQSEALEEELESIRADVPFVMTTRAVEPMKTRVLPRGNWMDDSGELVQPGVPAILGTLAVEGRRANRLDLANWLVRKDNALLARVMVNRLWKLCFGRGLVATLDDFGRQGQAPQHPELLDHLAREFVETGWDIRHVLRQIVNSNAYQQSSAVSAESLAADPANERLARQERFRLDAEFVRDNALRASGLLVTNLGGPSVFPYQPPGYWRTSTFRNAATRLRREKICIDAPSMATGSGSTCIRACSPSMLQVANAVLPNAIAPTRRKPHSCS